MAIYIVAEIGINHQGSVPLAKTMIDAANRAGADAVKFQFYRVTPTFLKQYKDPAIRKYVQQSEFKFFAMKAVAKHAKRQGLNFICTPFGIREAEILADKFQELDYIKVRAVDSGRGDLLDFIGNHTNLDAFISLPNTLDDDPRVLIRERFFADDPSRAQFLYCVPFYPPTPEQMHLYAIHEKGFEGLSDHNPSNESALAAIAYGAKIIEKHVYLTFNDTTEDGRAYVHHDPSGPSKYRTQKGEEVPNPLLGIDRPVSITFTQLKKLVRNGRKLEVECYGSRSST